MANMRTVKKTVRFLNPAEMAEEFGALLCNIVNSMPCPGAKGVFWLIDGQWVHKGWLMPSVIPCPGGGYKYGG